MSDEDVAKEAARKIAEAEAAAKEAARKAAEAAEALRRAEGEASASEADDDLGKEETRAKP